MKVKFTKDTEERIAYLTANTWVEWSLRKILNNQSPAKLSVTVANNVLGTMIAVGYAQERGDVSRASFNRICSMTLTEAIEIIRKDRVRFAKVIAHFTPKNH